MAHFVKVMLVEDEAEVREGFRAAFAHCRTMSLVYETDSERQALDYLEIHEVDVMILDIELTEGDGLSLLYEIEVRGLEKPFIIVVTNTGSCVTLGYMRAHGADYVYRKANLSYSPEKVLSVIEKIYPYQRIEEDRKCTYTLTTFKNAKEDQAAKKYIGDELEKMGFRRRQVGFVYIVEAIFLLLRNRTDQPCVWNEIYLYIAREHQTTQDGVERGIRNAIEAVFTGARVNDLHQYYPYDYDEEKGRPTNTEFLKNMAERLQL